MLEMLCCQYNTRVTATFAVVQHEYNLNRIFSIVWLARVSVLSPSSLGEVRMALRVRRVGAALGCTADSKPLIMVIGEKSSSSSVIWPLMWPKYTSWVLDNSKPHNKVISTQAVSRLVIIIYLQTLSEESYTVYIIELSSD